MTGWRARAAADLTAGLTTAVLLVPQSMAYAMLAGLPPIVGLYGATLPLIVYAVFGSSRELAVGPVAMVALLVASGVGKASGGDPQRAMQLAVLLSFMVGAIQIALALLRGGALLRHISRPVISGFTAAAALIIGFSQLGALLGVRLSRTHEVHTILWELLAQLDRVNAETAVLGIGSLAALLLVRAKYPRLPRALLVLALGSAAVAAGLSVSSVGPVPGELPALSWPGVPALGDLVALLPTALGITFVATLESIAVARHFAAREGYAINANRELFALGASNLGAGLVGAFVVTGGFSRTAVNAQAGPKSRWAGVVAAGFVLLSLGLLAPTFQFLPRAGLAALIISAVSGLFDIREAKQLFTRDRGGFSLWALTFVSTLGLGIELGLLIGTAASVVATLTGAVRRRFHAKVTLVPASDVSSGGEGLGDHSC